MGNWGHNPTYVRVIWVVIPSFPNLDEGTPKQRATAAARIRAKLAREKARAREHLVA